jgi:hypothetical protein
MIFWRRLRETTFFAAACWGAVAFLAVGYACISPAGDDPYVRYTVAVLLVAPTLALLGAKRPQNGAWQFIVLTLVGVLLLPVAQGLAFGDDRPHVHLLFRWVILTHIVVGTVNYLPTRFVGPACCFGAAQFLAAQEFLPFAMPLTSTPWAVLGLLVAAFSIASFLVCRGCALPPGLDRVWRDFRDAYGLVWGVRIAERLNASALKHGWPVEFTWGGMLVKSESGTLDDELRHRIERELRSHLRRFVSHDWIARRLSEP